MPQGEELNVLEDLSGWVKVDLDNTNGFISKDYVDISVQLPKAMTMTEVRYGNGVSDVRVDLISYATQFVGNPYVWGGTSLTNGADCSGFTLSIFANTVYICHIPLKHRQIVVQGSVHQRQNREIYSSTEAEAASAMLQFTLETDRSYMQVLRRSGIKISNAFSPFPDLCNQSIG